LKLAPVIALALGLAASPAMADLVFRVGDTVYVDGKRYTWEEWQGVRAGDRARAEPAAVKPSAARAASCVTSIYYAEFPSEDERFDCTAGLGWLTREELMRGGWRVDYVEKIAAPQIAVNPPVYKYKLVISR
jgi:hypothetical protein